MSRIEIDLKRLNIKGDETLSDYEMAVDMYPPDSPEIFMIHRETATSFIRPISLYLFNEPSCFNILIKNEIGTLSEDQLRVSLVTFYNHMKSIKPDALVGFEVEDEVPKGTADKILYLLGVEQPCKL